MLEAFSVQKAPQDAPTKRDAPTSAPPALPASPSPAAVGADTSDESDLFGSSDESYEYEYSDE